MSTGWSDQDKAVLKAAVERARKRAEQEVLREYQTLRIQSVSDLWALEQKIRGWRRQCDGRCYINYTTADADLREWLERGWLKLSDLQSMSKERLERITRKT
jgi:hypothetical protein